jgi:hypothetical protein
MHDKHLYEYSVIRVVPRVEREEFLNVGIIVFCKKQRFLQTRISVDEQKLLFLAPESDLLQVNQNLQSFEKICSGEKMGGPIALMDVAERFRWLTAVRSSVIQTSRPHPGITSDLESTFERLFADLVL